MGGEKLDCSYGDCDGNPWDLHPWDKDDFPRAGHLEYPDIPEIGVRYPLY